MADQLHFMCFIRDAYSLSVRNERQRNACHQCQGKGNVTDTWNTWFLYMLCFLSLKKNVDKWKLWGPYKYLIFWEVLLIFFPLLLGYDFNLISSFVSRPNSQNACLSWILFPGMHDQLEIKGPGTVVGNNFFPYWSCHFCSVFVINCQVPFEQGAFYSS